MRLTEITVSVSQRGKITRSTYKTYFVSLKAEFDWGETSESRGAILLRQCQDIIQDRAVKDGVELE